MNPLVHASTLLPVMIAMAVTLITALARWQAHLEQADAEKPFQQEWEESGWRSLHRGEFQLCRIVPIEDWPMAEFTFQDERRAELGRFRGLSHRAAIIEYWGCRGGEIVQIESSARREAQGASKHTILIHKENRLVAEVFRQAGISRTLFRLLWHEQEFQIEKRKWSVRGTNFIRRDEELIGVFRRPGGLSRKTLFAVRSDLPEELKVCLCSIAVLQ